MEIIGIVKKVLNAVSGETEKGFWTRRGVVIEHVNSKRNVCLEFSGEDWSEKLGNLKEGDFVKVLFAPESSEYEGKWYTRLKAFGLAVYNKATE